MHRARVENRRMTDILLPLCPDCLEISCECLPKKTKTNSSLPSLPNPDVNVIGKAGIGRGPTGKTRNFKAMRDEKLLAVYEELVRVGKDYAAEDAAYDEIIARGL